MSLWHIDVHELACGQALQCVLRGDDVPPDVLDAVLARSRLLDIATTALFPAVVEHVVSSRASPQRVTSQPSYLCCELAASRLYSHALAVVFATNATPHILRSFSGGLAMLRSLLKARAALTDSQACHVAQCGLRMLEGDTFGAE